MDRWPGGLSVGKWEPEKRRTQAPSSVQANAKQEWMQETMTPIWNQFHGVKDIKNKVKVLEKIVDELEISTNDPEVQRNISVYSNEIKKIYKNPDKYKDRISELGQNIEKFYRKNY